MDALMDRSRAFAEAVVIMVCPVLLAMALEKVDLKREEHGRTVPIVMLVVAAFTLISGAVPFLALSFTKRFSNNGAWSLPTKVTTCLAPLSCVCLAGLACWIMRLILPKRWAYVSFPIAPLFVLCILVITIKYCRAQNGPDYDPDMRSKLENSLEFLAGVTALLFLGLEGLALEGQTQIINGGDQVQLQHRLAKQMGPMALIFLACMLGVLLVLVVTIPILPGNNDLVVILRAFDIVMALAITSIMLSVMIALVKLLALLLLSPLFMILLVLAFDVTVGSKTVGVGDSAGGGRGDGGPGAGAGSAGSSNDEVGDDGSGDGGSGSSSDSSAGSGCVVVGASSGGSGSGSGSSAGGGGSGVVAGTGSGGGGGGRNDIEVGDSGSGSGSGSSAGGGGVVAGASSGGGGSGNGTRAGGGGSGVVAGTSTGGGGSTSGGGGNDMEVGEVGSGSCNGSSAGGGGVVAGDSSGGGGSAGRAGGAGSRVVAGAGSAGGGGGRNDIEVGDAGSARGSGSGSSGGGGQDRKPASLELTKVTFAAFLAVSIPAISSGSPTNKWTDWFLVFAASAILSGLAWRLLTHNNEVKTANFASFCTHLCIAMATVPFTVMAGEALR